MSVISILSPLRMSPEKIVWPQWHIEIFYLPVTDNSAFLFLKHASFYMQFGIRCYNGESEGPDNITYCHKCCVAEWVSVVLVPVSLTPCSGAFYSSRGGSSSVISGVDVGQSFISAHYLFKAFLTHNLCIFLWKCHSSHRPESKTFPCSRVYHVNLILLSRVLSLNVSVEFVLENVCIYVFQMTPLYLQPRICNGLKLSFCCWFFKTICFFPFMCVLLSLIQISFNCYKWRAK